ncbi:antitoxin MazE family protein [Mesorhizobium sp. M1312]|uniref:antitoxin MazE family protein n=2 Tax=unclassified Mesorhizobium TaxID=325217 RepID=UPI003334C922
MASASKPKSSGMKVREHRERLRRQGQRPIQIWVPDVRAPAFRSEAHRQSLMSRQAPMQARIRRSLT